MDCRRAYDWLIQRARLRPRPATYFEVHHVVPRSLGGGDEEANLVALTYREHFLAHWLLFKMQDESLARRKMSFAFHAMRMASQGRQIAGWQVELAKRVLKDQRLDTAKRRAEFLYQQQRVTIRKHVDLHRRLGELDRDELKKATDSFLAIDAMRRREEKSGRRMLASTQLHRAIREVGLAPLPAKNTKIKKSRSTHNERLARWKANRVV